MFSFAPFRDGGVIEIFRGLESRRREDDVIYVDDPVAYMVYRARQFLQQYPTADILLVIPQGTQTKTALELSFTRDEAVHIDYLQWGNLIPRAGRLRRVLHQDDLCMIYATQEQVELGQSYIEHIRDRRFMWGMFAPQVEYVRKVVQ